MPKEQEHMITMRFPKELVQRYKRVAQNRHRSFNGQVVVALEEWVTWIEAQGPRQEVVPPEPTPERVSS